MGQIDQAFFPPRLWQQFEDLTLGCFRIVLKDPHAEKNGRSGFPQAGVDVYGQGPDGFTGIQCKQIDPVDPNGELLPAGKVTKAQLLDEIAKAEAFAPRLDVFIMATTGATNPKLQKVVRDLNVVRKTAGTFRVVLWFWDDYRFFLNASSVLQEWFYADVLRLFTRHDEDRQMLDFYAESFHRPAFENPLSVEDLQAFPQALEDTQTALRTGQLFDRRSRSLIRQSLGWRRLSDPAMRDGLALVDKNLAALRKALVQAQVDGHIYRRGTFMEIRNPHVRDELDMLRRACVTDLNSVLNRAGIPPI